MKPLLTILLTFSLGCGDEICRGQKSIHPATSLQIRIVNSLIDTKTDPALGRLSRNPILNTVKINGFDFVKGMSTSDFPKLFSVSYRVTGDELRKRNNYHPRMQSWVESKDIATIFYTIDTDLWGIGDGTQAIDLLVIATDNATITDWGLFPIVPY